MTINTEQYLRKPIKVDAVQVTEENIFEVAMWCNGEIIWKTQPSADTKGAVEYIRVRVHSPQSDRQKQAYVGDWVLSSSRGYKVYTDRAFHNSFELEPSRELKRAWKEFVKSSGNALEEAKAALGGIKIETDENIPPGDFAVVQPDGSKVHYRSGKEPEAVCNVCGAPKGTHAIGERCNANCGGGIVIANPRLESQSPN